MLRVQTQALAAIAWLAVACAPPPDEPPEPWRVAPPMPPAAVQMSCPPGWSLLTRDDGTAVCDPWTGARPTCSDTELLVPGSGCEPISDCAVEPLQPGQAVVEAGAPGGGDGSPASPFASIREALAGGATDLVLGPGEHLLDRPLANVRVSGACPTTTTVMLTGFMALRNVELRRVRVTGGVGRQLTVPASTSLTLEEVIVDGTDRAVEVGGSLVARRVLVRNVASGVVGFEATALDLDHVTFDGTTRSSIYAERMGDVPGAAVTLRDVAIVDGRAGDAGQIRIDGGEVITERVTIEDCVGIGMTVRADTLSVRDLTVRRVAGPGLAVLGRSGDIASVHTEEVATGVLIADGTFTLRNVVVERSTDLGIAVENATIDVVGVRVAGARSAGLALGNAHGTATDVSISDVEATPTTRGSGGGVLVERASTVTLTRLRVERARAYGVGVYGANLTATDVTVRDVESIEGADDGGYGLVAVERSSIDLARIDVLRVHTVGLSVEDSLATAVDVRIEGVAAIDGTNGIGILVSTNTPEPASLSIQRAEVFDTVRWAVLASGPGILVATHINARGVAAAPCGSTTCRETAGGAAFVAHDGARVELTEFRAEEAVFAGVIATASVRTVLVRGTITRNAVGLVVSPSLAVNLGETPGLDLMDVVLTDNVRDQQATDVTVVRPIIGPITR